MLGQEKLPPESQTLIDKLTQYEVQIRKEAETKIEVKRKAVVTALQSHLQAQTKRGNLNGAIAIKEQIAKLTSESSAKQPTKSTPLPKPDTRARLEKWLVGTTWEWTDEGRGKQRITFLEDSRLTVTWNDGKLPWNITRDKKVEIRTFNKELYLIEFSEDRTSFFGNHESKGKISGKFEHKK